VWNTLVVSSGFSFSGARFFRAPAAYRDGQAFSRRQQAGNERRRVTPIANAGPVRACHEKRRTT